MAHKAASSAVLPLQALLGNVQAGGKALQEGLSTRDERGLEIHGHSQF